MAARKGSTTTTARAGDALLRHPLCTPALHTLPPALGRYDIHHNVILGEGLKQDYGGHDSKYHDNLNLVQQYDGQNCINTRPRRTQARARSRAYSASRASSRASSSSQVAVQGGQGPVRRLEQRRRGVLARAQVRAEQAPHATRPCVASTHRHVAAVGDMAQHIQTKYPWHAMLCYEPGAPCSSTRRTTRRGPAAARPTSRRWRTS